MQENGRAYKEENANRRKESTATMKVARQVQQKKSEGCGSVPTRIEICNEAFALWEIESHNIVVVPSLSFSGKELQTINCIQGYEERILFVLFALANPETHLLIVTSEAMDAWIIRYYLSLLPEALQKSARKRVRFYSLEDPTPDRCLTQKLCDSRPMLERIRNYCAESHTFRRGSPQEHYMMIWRATEHEYRLGKLLGLPFSCATPEQSLFGTKQGSRSIFKLLNIPCADGTYEEERDLDELYKSIWKVLRRNPTATKGVFKLSESFSGMGNAVLDLVLVQKRLKAMADDCSWDAELMRLSKVAFMNATFHHHTWESYCEEINEMGCIFELFIDKDSSQSQPESNDKRTITSPSVQGIVDEHGNVSMLSSHEQLLDDQVYLGCEFPCNSEYRLKLLEYGRRIGDFLAQAGVHDRFGVDFLCVPHPRGQWKIYAVEINLRMTGTTHPWMTLKLLTHGNIDSTSGLFIAPNGQAKYYVSSDHVSVPVARNKLYPVDLFRLIRARPDLNWDTTQQRGVVLHMLARVSKAGTLSMTAIANSLEEAHKLFDDTRNYLAEAARGP